MSQPMTSPQMPTSTQMIYGQSAANELPPVDPFMEIKSLEDLMRSGQAAQIVKWAEGEYMKCKSQRQSQEVVWYENIAAYSRRDNNVAVTRRIDGAPMTVNKKDNDPFYINRIRPFVRTEIARFISNSPTATVIPATADVDDMYVAQAAEQVWENQYKERGVRDTFVRSVWWLTIAGNGFVKTWWDKSVVDPRANDGLPEPVSFGDICYGNVTPFNLWVPDLLQEDIEKQPYVIEAYTKPKEWVELAYGEFLKKIGMTVEADAKSATEILDEVKLGIKGSGEPKVDSVLIKEFWVKPGATKLLPQGGMFTIINGKIIQAALSGLPYGHGMYPYAKFDNIPTGGFYSASCVEDLIPLNKEYNELRRIIRAVGKMNASPQFFYAEGSTNPKRITNKPGQYIPIKPGMNYPTPVPRQDIPVSIVNNLQSTLVDFEDISGQHQVSKGSAPPGVTAATAINYLQEKDDSYSATAYVSIERGMEKIGKQTLNLAVDYWDTERMITILGEDNGLMDTMLIKGSDLKRGTNIRIDGGSSMPQSGAGKRAYLMELLQMQVITPEQFLDLAEIGGMRNVNQTLKIDRNQATRENIKFRQLTPEIIQVHGEAFRATTMQLMQENPEEFISMQLEENGITAEQFGMMPPEEQEQFLDIMAPPQVPLVIPVNEWDNHEVHIQVHNDFRKTQQYELLPQEIRDMMDQHVRDHEAAMHDKQMNMMMDQSLGFGGPEQLGGDIMSMGEGQLPPDLLELNLAPPPEETGEAPVEGAPEESSEAPPEGA